MASIIKRKRNKKTTFLVFIRRKGVKPMRKSFINKTDAKKWARAVERKLDTGDYSNYEEASKLLLGDLFKRYISENKHKKMKSWKMYEFRIRIILQDTITDINLLRISSKHLAEFRDRKLKEVGPATFNKYLSLISVVIDTAMQDWGIYLSVNPCRLIKREKEPNPRGRTLIDDEYERLLEACERSDNIYLKSMVIFSVETAIRQGELLKAKYDDINMQNRTLLLKDTKNGEDRLVPLSPTALQILVINPRNEYDKIFPVTCDSLKHWFKQAKRRAQLKDFRWHDLRRYACSRLFEKGLSVPEVQLISGHKDPRVLLNTYTKLDPVKIARKL